MKPEEISRAPAWAPAPAIYSFGNIRVNAKLREARTHRTRIQLTGKNFDVLIYILEQVVMTQNSELVSRRHILDAIWPRGQSISVDSALWKIRTAFKNAGEEDPIQNVRAEGLRLKERVNLVSPDTGSGDDNVFGRLTDRLGAFVGDSSAGQPEVKEAHWREGIRDLFWAVPVEDLPFAFSEVLLMTWGILLGRMTRATGAVSLNPIDIGEAQIEGLPQLEKQVFMLYSSGKEVPEIAGSLEISPATVESTLGRAILAIQSAGVRIRGDRTRAERAKESS